VIAAWCSLLPHFCRVVFQETLSVCAIRIDVALDTTFVSDLSELSPVFDEDMWWLR